MFRVGHHAVQCCRRAALSLGPRTSTTATATATTTGARAAVSPFVRCAASFKDVYAKTTLGALHDIRGHSVEGTVVRDTFGNTEADLRSFVPNKASGSGGSRKPSGRVLVDVGLKFPISVDCSRARLGRDRCEDHRLAMCVCVGEREVLVCVCGGGREGGVSVCVCVCVCVRLSLMSLRSLCFFFCLFRSH